MAIFNSYVKLPEGKSGKNHVEFMSLAGHFKFWKP